MTRHTNRRLLALGLLVATAPLAGGCAFARRAFPQDATGMRYPARYFADQTREQVRITDERISGLPSATTSHVARSWRRLMVGTEGHEEYVDAVPTAGGGVAYR